MYSANLGLSFHVGSCVIVPGAERNQSKAVRITDSASAAAAADIALKPGQKIISRGICR